MLASELNCRHTHSTNRVYLTASGSINHRARRRWLPQVCARLTRRAGKLPLASHCWQATSGKLPLAGERVCVCVSVCVRVRGKQIKSVADAARKTKESRRPSSRERRLPRSISSGEHQGGDSAHTAASSQHFDDIDSSASIERKLTCCSQRSTTHRNDKRISRIGIKIPRAKSKTRLDATSLARLFRVECFKFSPAVARRLLWLLQLQL